MCYTQYGTRFTVTEDTVIPAGSICAEAPCICETVGECGNVAADTVTYMAVCPVGVVACTNNRPFTGGSDRESDELLRQRVLNSYRNLPNGANEAYYEKTALENPDVTAVKVLPKNRGIGTVDVVITSKDGVPDDELVEEIQSTLNRKREICVDVRVEAPTCIPVSITAEIDILSGYGFAEVAAEVRSRLEAYFDGTLLGKDLLIAQIADIIYNTDGVRNYRIVFPRTDIDILETELPVLGTLTISRLGDQ